MRKKKVFTLIELLVVIAIVAIMAGLLLPALKTARDTAKRVFCVGNMKNHGIGYAMYTNDFNRYFPTKWPFESPILIKKGQLKNGRLTDYKFTDKYFNRMAAQGHDRYSAEILNTSTYNKSSPMIKIAYLYLGTGETFFCPSRTRKGDFDITATSQSITTGPQTINYLPKEGDNIVAGTKWDYIIQNKPNFIVEACYFDGGSAQAFTRNHFAYAFLDITIMNVKDWPHRPGLNGIALDGSAKTYDSVDVYYAKETPPINTIGSYKYFWAK